MKKHHTSVFNNHSELLKAVLDIHNDGKPIELDPMYSKGNFYKKLDEPKLKFDINPLNSKVKKADARSLPLEPVSIESMILDPPFFWKKPSKNSLHNRHMERFGYFENKKKMFDFYFKIIQEARRVLKQNGLLIFKCQDFTDKHTWFVHILVYNYLAQSDFYVCDLAILQYPKPYNPSAKQRHLRKVHSYFYVAYKGGRIINGKSFFDKKTPTFKKDEG